MLTENQVKTLGEKAKETSGAKNEREVYLWLLENHARRRNWLPTQKQLEAKTKRTKKENKIVVEQKISKHKKTGKRSKASSPSSLFTKEQNIELDRIKKEVGL